MNVSDLSLHEWIGKLEIILAERESTIVHLKRALLDPSISRKMLAAHPSTGESDFASGTAPDLVALVNEVAARDVEIARLQEQIVHQEASFAVERAEWETIRHWIEEVEERIEESGHYDEIFNTDPILCVSLTNEIAIRAESPLNDDWELERGKLLNQIATLRADLQQTHEFVGEPPAIDEAETEFMLETIQNQKEEIETLRNAHDEQSADFQTLDEDHQRTIEKLRSELKDAEARERKMVENYKNQAIRFETTHALESDERIRAFRQHLDRIHAEEAASRSNRGLINLSWFQRNRKS